MLPAGRAQHQPSLGSYSVLTRTQEGQFIKLPILQTRELQLGELSDSQEVAQPEGPVSGKARPRAWFWRPPSELKTPSPLCAPKAPTHAQDTVRLGTY